MTMTSTVALALAATLTTPDAQQGRATSTLQGFNIVLVAGEMQPQGTAPDDNVPPAARKALNDMKDFLPFKHYRLLDSQWTLCCSGIEDPITGRLRAMLPGDNLEYIFQLTVRRGADQVKLPISFTLAPTSSRGASVQGGISPAREAELERRLAELRREVDSLEDEVTRRRERLGAKHPDVLVIEQQQQRVRQRIDEVQIELNAGRPTPRPPSAGVPLIDSNFTMEVGETVVVGTSAIGGNKALIAIVTAVRKGTPGR